MADTSRASNPHRPADEARPPPPADAPLPSFLAAYCERYGEDLSAVRRRIEAQRERDRRTARAIVSGTLPAREDEGPRRLTADEMLAAVRRRPDLFAELADLIFERQKGRITDIALAVVQEAAKRAQ
jgi:hypothetical protein